MIRIARILAGAAAVASLALAPAAWAQAPAPAPKSELALAVEKALASDIRTADERARDNPERKPLQTLEFFGLQPNMTVVEIMPGAGWYSKILAPVLADKGKYYVTIGEARLAPRLKEWKLDKAEAIASKAELKPSGQFGVFQAESIEIPVKNADMVLTFRNYHNMTPDTRAKLNRAVFATLKPGGVYGLIDHTLRHMETAVGQTWRRIDPVLVIKEVQAAGFVLEDYSTLHHRPDDSLQHDSQVPSLKGHSDRFTLRFRKPAK